MSDSAKQAARSPVEHRAAGKGWALLTWDDLDQWAGGRSVSRGRSYQRQGRVTDLAIAEDGRLLATVMGRQRYIVSVHGTKRRGKSVSIESQCTCPVGLDGCKHAVAVVGAYLQTVADGTEVQVADEDDPRWDQLSGENAQAGDEGLDTVEDELDEDENDLSPRPTAGPRGKRTRTDWDQKIREHIRAKSSDELAELVWSLTQRFAELREEFKERVAVGEGDVGRLVGQARRELLDVTAETGWRNSWDGQGNTPDYGRLRHKLERLVELGHCDEVVRLGRELMDRGMQQVEQSHDEGETATGLSGCLPVVFDALAKASLSVPQKILFAIDTCLKDDYDLIGEAANPVLEARWAATDWSAVADALAARLGKPAAEGDDFAHKYQRDRISNWLLQALQKAGRKGECLPILEAEARTTGSYERLVNHLIAARRFEDAERWASEGIDKTREKWPGIAASLAKSLCELARSRRHWSVVAAHAACGFFENPSRAGFNELVKASRRAKCEEKVRAAAMQFLETGIPPIRLAASGMGPEKLSVASDWPLPMPEHLAPLMRGRRPPGSGKPMPRFDVLLDMAIADDRGDDVLHWYDKIRARRDQESGIWYSGPSDAERVADAVAQSHPERAIEIYRQRLKKQTAQADRNAYESAGATLRKMRPVLRKLSRESEFEKLLADLRLQYRNRPRFMEVLDKVERRPIVVAQASRGRHRGSRS